MYVHPGMETAKSFSFNFREEFLLIKKKHGKFQIGIALKFSPKIPIFKVPKKNYIVKQPCEQEGEKRVPSTASCEVGDFVLWLIQNCKRSSAMSVSSPWFFALLQKYVSQAYNHVMLVVSSHYIAYNTCPSRYLFDTIS
jgi:hypothetical protein